MLRLPKGTALLLKSALVMLAINAIAKTRAERNRKEMSVIVLVQESVFVNRLMVVLVVQRAEESDEAACV